MNSKWWFNWSRALVEFIFLFQNTLSTLSIQSIQQFLDELTLRETWGTHPLQCFNVTLGALSNVTTNAKTQRSSVPILLRRTCDTPFLDFAAPQVLRAVNFLSKLKCCHMFIANYFLFYFTYFAKASKRPLASPDLPPVPSANRSDKPPEKKPKPGPGEKVTLDSYYYANMDGQGEVRATKNQTGSSLQERQPIKNGKEQKSI